MFEQEIKLNQFLLGYFEKVVADIPADRLTEPAPGNGHPPLWVLGHLAICTEFGEMFFDKPADHDSWLPIFGPGSSDQVENADQFSKDELVRMSIEGYPRLCKTLSAASAEAIGKPHGLELLDGSGLDTVGDLQSHLLTSHFAFHLAQLSGWRRAAGKGPLF